MELLLGNIWENKYESGETDYQFTYLSAGTYYITLQNVSEFQTLSNNVITDLCWIGKNISSLVSSMADCYALTGIGDFMLPSTQNLDISYCFANCSSLVEIPNRIIFLESITKFQRNFSELLEINYNSRKFNSWKSCDNM